MTPTVIPIDSETKKLKAELEESRAELERLRVEILHWMDVAQVWRERAEARAMPVHQISEEMLWQIEAQLQARAQCNQQANQAMAAQQFYAQDGFYLQGLGQQGLGQAQQSAFGQGSVWHDCTCVPGRSALLRGETP